MLIIPRKMVWIFMLAMLFFTGVWLSYLYQRSHFKMGEHYIHINPAAKINPEKEYHLELWDYDWPECNYKSCVNRAIIDFQKLYPNIHITVKWLDWMNGEEILKEAVSKGTAPDVYCAVYDVIPFNYKFQIPVGPFLTQTEKNVYNRTLVKMSSVNGVLCYFPRWASLNLCLANPVLLEKSGYLVSKIQKEGWSWQDLKNIGNTLPEKTYALAGNTKAIASEGMFFKFTSQLERANVIENITILKNLKENKRIPKDFDTNMLGRFITGEVAVICGVRPVLFEVIKKIMEAKKITWSPWIVPYPKIADGKEYQSVENGFISIYRNRRTKGDDHVVAAIKLGQFLSMDKNTQIFWQARGLIPGYQGFGATENIKQFYDNISNRVKWVTIKREQQEYSDLLIKKVLLENHSVEEIITELEKE